MTGVFTAAPPKRTGPRPLPIVFSLCVHATLLGLVALGPAPSRRAGRHRSPYEELFKPQEHKLVWYSFRKKLPDVSPPENARSSEQPAIQSKLPQTILSNPREAAPGTQLIWRPVPQIKPQPEIASPNILAFRLPLIAPPALGPPPKPFVPPRPKQLKQPEPTPVLPEPPKILERAELKQDPPLMPDPTAALANRPKPRQFVPPLTKPVERKVSVALPEAPKVASNLRSDRAPMLAENMAAPLANKPQPRTFVPPAAKPQSPSAPSALPEAPKVAGELANAASTGNNPALNHNYAAALANQPKPRAFVPPTAATAAHGTPGGRSGGASSAPVIQEAPVLNAGALPSANVNVAIVGLNPAEKLAGPLPESSRAAKFSAGPEPNGNSKGAGSPSGSLLSVPGLVVRGASPNARPPENPVLMARAAPTSPEMLAAAAKNAAAVSGDGQSTEIRLAPPPGPQFAGRDVYTLAIQMPNISSYVGSWIMWFAERDPSGPQVRHDLSPPVPMHKVDPKYYPSAITDRIEGKVQIAGVILADGHVDQLRVLRGVDPRLDASAVEALQKWQFEPAQRQGQAVAVDMVAEIPFLLAPAQTKR